MKFVHKYQWKLFTNTSESLHGSISTHWPLKLKLDPEAGFCSYNWRGMSRHCLILILNIVLLVLNTFLSDINYSATFNILAKSPLDIIPCFWQGRKPYSKCWCWITKEILMVSNCLSKLLFLGADPHVPDTTATKTQLILPFVFYFLPICLGIANPLTGGQNEKLLRLLF